MNKLILEFNPDFNTVKDLKEAARILRDLVKRRQQFQGEPDEQFVNSFDCLTQNVESSS